MGMLPVRYFHSYTCLITVFGGRQGHAPCRILPLLHMSYNWLGGRQGHAPCRILPLLHMSYNWLGGRQGHAPCRILPLLHMSYNCVWGVDNGMLPVKYYRSTKPLFVSIIFHGDHMAITKWRWIWSPFLLGILPDLWQWCLSWSIDEVSMELEMNYHILHFFLICRSRFYVVYNMFVFQIKDFCWFSINHFELQKRIRPAKCLCD